MSSVHLSFASVITDDIVGLSNFYARLLGLEEVIDLRSEHFRGLWLGNTVLGFSSPKAYELLKLERPQNDSGSASFLTFEVDDDEQVAAVTDAAIAAGARCVSPPARTYYGAWQSVLIDPAGNAFRVNHLELDRSAV